jgi:zinc protease
MKSIPGLSLRVLLAPCAVALLAHCTRFSPDSWLPAVGGPADPAPSARQAAPRLEPVTEVEGISEYRLPNGLKVLLFPDPSVATITVNVTYRVGSRHEGPGEGGMAHLLEHMVFKGTPGIPDLKGALGDRGAQWNGTTNVDRTNYFESFPASADNLDFVLKLEADRMVNSTISAKDLASEMTVVRNEFESGENNPQGVLSQRMMATAFLFHAYGRPTIGNQSDIERVPVESLRRFYRKYYQPDNAMLVVAGRFETEPALRKIQQYFGALPRPERVLEDTYTVEPPQDGPRSVVLSRVGGVSATGVLYHVPAGSHADAPALNLLARVLADRPSGRLYKSLVETRKAASVSAFGSSRREPGVLSVYASVPADQDVERVQAALIAEVEKVAGTVKPEEVERARNRVLKEIRVALTDSRRVALSLSEYEATGDWRLLFLNRDRLQKVSADDVNRVARDYLIVSNRTAGLFRPVDRPRRAEIPVAPDLVAALQDYRGLAAVQAGQSFEATPENIERSTERKKLGDIKLALLPKKTRGEVIQGRLRLSYGTAESLRGREAAAGLLPALMMRGTAKRDYQALRDALDALDTDLTLIGGVGRLDATLRTTRTHLPAALELLAEILRTPSLPAEQLELLRKELLTDLQAQVTDPEDRLENALGRALGPYPKGTVLYRPTLEEQIARTRKLARKDLADLHRRFLGASHAEASFVGDFDPAELETLLGRALGSWASREPHERIDVPYVAIQPLAETIDTPDKKMAIVGRGAALRLRTDDPDYPALRFANYVLGQSRKSRLWNALRENGGLSYSVGSALEVSDEDEVGVLRASAIAAPQNARRAQELMRQEFARWLEQPLSEAEIDEFRTGYLESFRTQLSDNAYLANALLADLRVDRSFLFRQRVVGAALQLTPDEIQQALRRRVGSVAFVDLLAGDSAKFQAGPPAGGPPSAGGAGAGQVQ